MLNKRINKIVLALALVAIISNALWFSSPPASAMSINITNPAYAYAGNTAYFTVTLNVNSPDILPVSTVQMDIFNVNHPYTYRDTFTNLPLYPTASNVYCYSITNTSHIMAISATGSNWGTGTADRQGTGTFESGTTGNYTFGYGTGWGYSSNGVYQGTADLTYTVSWNIPFEFPPGTYQAQVRVGTGSSYTFLTSGSNFTTQASSTLAPTISSISPTSGVTGTSVIINGNNLSSVTAVTFGGVAAQSYTIYPTYIIAVVGSSGTSGYISVRNPYGTANSSSRFTYVTNPAPTITSFSPVSGGQGTMVTINGANLSNTSKVTIGGTAVESYTAYSNYITAVVGSGSSGAVSVTTPNGTATLAGFTHSSTAGTTSLSGKVSSAGVFNTSVIAISNDNQASVAIASGVTGKLNGVALTRITVNPLDAANAPAAPADSNAVSMTYDFCPNGATFNSPVTVTLKYDPALIPAGVAESSLYIAWWDAANSKWVSLPSTVDTVNKKITAQVDHFTCFTVIASTKQAQFGVTNIQIAPKQVQVGEEVTISVMLGNVGGNTGSYDVKLRINGNVISTRPERLDSLATKTVTFITTQNTPGTYKAEVEYLSDTFTVTAVPTVSSTPTPNAKPTATTPAAVTPTVTASPGPKPEDKPTQTVNWWLIGGVIVIFLIIIWIIYRVIVYQRKSLF